MSLEQQPVDAAADVTAEVTTDAASVTTNESNLGVKVEKKLTSEVTETTTVTGAFVKLARNIALSLSVSQT